VKLDPELGHTGVGREQARVPRHDAPRLDLVDREAAPSADRFLTALRHLLDDRGGLRRLDGDSDAQHLL
jgi:hypothetical protein